MTSLTSVLTAERVSILLSLCPFLLIKLHSPLAEMCVFPSFARFCEKLPFSIEQSRLWKLKSNDNFKTLDSIESRVFYCRFLNPYLNPFWIQSPQTAENRTFYFSMIKDWIHEIICSWILLSYFVLKLNENNAFY